MSERCPCCNAELTDIQAKRLRMLGTDVDKIDLVFRIDELRSTIFLLNLKIEEQARTIAAVSARLEDTGQTRVG